jgi:hypothetical protein
MRASVETVSDDSQRSSKHWVWDHRAEDNDHPELEGSTLKLNPY